MSYPRRVYRSFYARDLKKTIYSEICRLYISLWSIQAGNDVVPSTTFSPHATPVLYCPRSSRSIRIHWEYLFLLRPPLALLSQQISCHRTAIGANRFWRDSRLRRFRKLINLENLSYFLHFSLIPRNINSYKVYGETEFNVCFKIYTF